MTTMVITGPNKSRPHAWVGVACFWVGKLELDVAAAGGLGAVLIRLCSSVIHGHLALQRDDGVGALRRRGDRPRAEFRVVDVGRRPPRPKNHNTIKADAVYSSSDWTEAGLDGTGDDGTGPIWPRGVFA